MKIVVGIVAVAVLIAALTLFVLILFNSHDLVFCGDIAQNAGNSMSVTRVYSSDLNANITLAEVVTAMNQSENGNISAEEMAELLATYQEVIYAPKLVFTLEQTDTKTYILTGNVYNGLDEDGEPITSDYMYKNLTMTAGIANGKILAAQNLYSDDTDEDGEPEFKERSRVVDPIIVEDETAAAFAFRECDGFRMVMTGEENFQTAVTMVFSYDITAANTLDFTNMKDLYIAVTVTANYDEDGRLAPTLVINRDAAAEE